MNHCRKCGCTLDPGEGKICDECREKIEKMQTTAGRLQMMIKSKDFKQMSMEDYLK